MPAPHEVRAAGKSHEENEAWCSTGLKNVILRVCRGEGSLQGANFLMCGNVSRSPQLQRRLAGWSRALRGRSTSLQSFDQLLQLFYS